MITAIQKQKARENPHLKDNKSQKEASKSPRH